MHRAERAAVGVDERRVDRDVRGVDELATTVAAVIGAPLVETEPARTKPLFCTSIAPGRGDIDDRGHRRGARGRRADGRELDVVDREAGGEPSRHRQLDPLVAGFDTASAVWLGVGVARTGSVAFAVPTTADAALKAVRRTESGAPSGLEYPTQTRTLVWTALNVAPIGAEQNSTATQFSTATVPECANPAIAELPFE